LNPFMILNLRILVSLGLSRIQKNLSVQALRPCLEVAEQTPITGAGHGAKRNV